MSADRLFSPATMSGFVFGLGLIFSLGPQNLMLIRAGMMRDHPLAVASTGYVSEIALVAMGIGGLGTLLMQHPTMSGALQIGCAGFLAWWGAHVLLGVSRSSRAVATTEVGGSRSRAVGSMLAVTWFNPLVWLEAMFLVGVFSSSYASEAQTEFAMGFLSASAIKFYGWSLVGVGLSRRFNQPICRKRMDAVAGFVLIAAAVLLSINIYNAAQSRMNAVGGPCCS
jgi:L-lysine exporter family protein LysE/ArgO